MNRSVILLSHGDHGHRRAYIDQFSALLSDHGVDAEQRTHWRGVVHERSPVLFLMIEEAFFGYAVAALYRALCGRRTVGLLFRGGDCVRGASLRLRLKRWMLKALKAVRNVRTLTITAFDVEPALEAVADGWIHDPQLWDLPDGPASVETPLSRQVRDAAAGRRTLIALGLQNGGKGFEAFCRLWLDDPGVRRSWLFVSAGKVDPAMAAQRERFDTSGGMSVDRFISDEELLSLFGEGAVIWCCYAPDYDQASGIFGRAYQFEKPVVVRSGSQIDALAARLGQPVVRMDWDKPPTASIMLSASPVAPGPRVPVGKVKADSLAALDDALDGLLGGRVS